MYFPNSFEVYLALRVLLGLVSVSVTYAGLILAIEFVDGKWRTSKNSIILDWISKFRVKLQIRSKVLLFLYVA